MLRQKLNDSLKEAMKTKDQRRVGTLRLILAAIKDRDIAMRTEDQSEQDDDQIIQDIMGKMVKQRRDSIVAYEEGGRCELAEREREEIAVIEEFLPKQLNEKEISAAVDQIIDEIGAEGLKDIGRCMGALKSKYAGQMDFSKASAEVKSRLA